MARGGASYPAVVVGDFAGVDGAFVADLDSEDFESDDFESEGFESEDFELEGFESADFDSDGLESEPLEEPDPDDFSLLRESLR